MLGVALIGVGWYAKCQVGLLVILVVAMLSVALGTFFPGVPDSEDNKREGFVGYAEAPGNFGPDYSVDVESGVDYGEWRARS